MGLRLGYDKVNNRHVITEVKQGSPAMVGGIFEDDVIWAINGEPIQGYVQNIIWIEEIINKLLIFVLLS